MLRFLLRRLSILRQINLSRLAVETNIFPLFEIIDGVEYRITHQPQHSLVNEYLKPQE